MAGLTPLALAVPGAARVLTAAGGPKNVIVLVLDALSAYNLSIHGYARQTAPNLARLAKRAIVYHSHYAGSNFTTSGTASLLTGTLPWTHRAIEDDGQVAAAVQDHNLFEVFRGYYRTAFSHNSWVNSLLRQFGHSIEELVPREKLYLGSYDGPIHQIFARDDDASTVAWTRYIKPEGGYSYSLFLSGLYGMLRKRQVQSYEAMFPLGLPIDGSKDAFVLEQAVDWLRAHLIAIPRPFLSYLHFLPPHAPYRPPRPYYRRFAGDGYHPAAKPRDVFANKQAPANFLEDRTRYDEFILYADEAFGRLFDSLQASGLLEDSWLVVTSDHGEMFERGFVGHGNPTLYQPVIRVPLMIFEPGRKAGVDIQAPTSAADVLPTLAHLAGRAAPPWVEGTVLPPFGPDLAEDRGVYALTARKNGRDAPIHRATAMLAQGRYKLIYSFGYEDIGIGDSAKLFDVQADPEELEDLAASQPGMASDMLRELTARLEEVNAPYL